MKKTSLIIYSSLEKKPKPIFKEVFVGPKVMGKAQAAAKRYAEKGLWIKEGKRLTYYPSHSIAFCKIDYDDGVKKEKEKKKNKARIQQFKNVGLGV